MKTQFTGLLAVLGLVGCIGQAHADFVTDLNVTQVSGFPSGTLGTVTVRDMTGTDAFTNYTGNYVQVTVDLIAATTWDFVNTSQNTAAFSFNSGSAIAATSVGLASGSSDASVLAGSPRTRERIWRAEYFPKPTAAYKSSILEMP